MILHVHVCMVHVHVLDTNHLCLLEMILETCHDIHNY